MQGYTRMRLLGGVLLAGVIATCCGLNEVDAAEKKAKKKPYDPTKKVAPVAGLLPAGTKLSAEKLARHIDALIARKMSADGVSVSPRTTDEEFLRRVYLDITGKVPTSEQALAFLDSKESNKRAKLIDELLASKEFGVHLADLWQAMLLPRISDNRRFVQYYPTLVKFLTDHFNANTPWDQLVTEIMTASGPSDKNGAVIYWAANATADKMTDNVTRMFMGVQLQCAQCHNHPFTDYKQDEYWGMAAFFLKVQPEGNPKAKAKDKAAISISEKAAKKGRRGLPESAKFLPPKFLQGEKPTIKSSDPARPALAKWMTDGKNPFFARAMVNRLWGQYFGRGIVNPVDDMHDANPATHPELLADLAGQFVANGFDIKYIVRAICNSEAYQRSSKPAGNNPDHGPETYARGAIKPLSPEQLYDSITVVLGTPGRGAAPRAKGGAAARNQGNAREQFVNFFGIEDGADPTEYQAGIPQVLRLMNAPQLNNSAVLSKILPGAKSDAEAVEKLYLTVLARRPTKEDQDRVLAFLAKNKAAPRREVFAGVLWALLNSSEFALNR